MINRFAWLLLLALLALAGCNDKGGGGGPDASGVPGPGGAKSAGFTILSGSENKTLEPIIKQFADRNNITIGMEYRGSVDIMMMLQSGSLPYDAVWPANGLWIDLGDKNKIVKDERSILWSPVVFGVKKSVAQKLGWVGKKDVKVEDILKAAEGGKLRYMMTSATQSNSGASAYLGYLYAFSGRPQVLSSADLGKPGLQDKIKRILGTVNRSSGSSGFLKDLFLDRYDQYDGMVNYEAVIIETNQELVRQNREPLYVVYPSDGLAIADSPLAYVDRKDAAKAELFKKLQQYLLSPEAQAEIVKQGRRVGPVGDELKGADPAVFNPDWGVSLTKFISPIRYPKSEVIREALDLYQSALRKPSFTVYCLDFSGSMQGDREDNLKRAMQMILIQDKARESLLQASKKDVTVVITFSSSPISEWNVAGNDPNALSKLWAAIDSSSPKGGTDIFTPVMRGMDLMKQTKGLEDYFPAVILLTDGESNEGKTMSDFQSYLQQPGSRRDIPVYAILFGDASTDQLNDLTKATSGKVFDGKGDLTRAFREAKGYN